MKPQKIQKLIQKELKKKYPNIGFSIETKTNPITIEISWVDGATKSEIKKTINEIKNRQPDVFNDVYILLKRKYSSEYGVYLYPGVDLSDGKPKLKDVVKNIYLYLRLSNSDTYEEKKDCFIVSCKFNNKQVMNMYEVLNKSGYTTAMIDKKILVISK